MHLNTSDVLIFTLDNRKARVEEVIQLRTANLNPKKKKNQLQKLLGSGNINSELFFQNTFKGRLRSFGRNSKGHSLFTQLSISRFS